MYLKFHTFLLYYTWIGHIGKYYDQPIGVWMASVFKLCETGSERRLPEDENKENEKREEDCNIVHCAQHDYQLPTQIRHETDQF